MDKINILKQIGNTPLIRLKQPSDMTGCNIYGKAEYFNPGESVKDRAALFIIEDALKKKKFRKSRRYNSYLQDDIITEIPSDVVQKIKIISIKRYQTPAILVDTHS